MHNKCSGFEKEHKDLFRRNFCTRFNFLYFVHYAECMKFSSIRKLSVCTSVCDTVLALQQFIRGETNRSNIRIKLFVHRCSNFISLFELFVPRAHEQNNRRSGNSQFEQWTSHLLVRHQCGSTSKRRKGRSLLRANFARRR